MVKSSYTILLSKSTVTPMKKCLSKTYFILQRSSCCHTLEEFQVPEAAFLSLQIVQAFVVPKMTGG
jgi:hypothetical protein